MTIRKQENANIPRGPLEELGAAKQKRLTLKLMADAVAHVVGACGVTLVVTLPEAIGNDNMTVATHSYVIWGRGMNLLQTAEQIEEMMLKHLENTEQQFPSHRANIVATIEAAKAARAEAQAQAEDLAEQAVPEEAFSDEKAHE
jgi:hypothetical protein